MNAAAPAERAAALASGLRAGGVTLAASLPDSWLSALLDAVEDADGMTHVRVTREDDGAAICAGAALAGERAVLLCQNAGLLLSTNGLAAYALHHQLPFLVLAALRGGADDGFFYQVYKERVTVPILDAIGLPHHVLDGPDDDHLVVDAMQQAWLARRPVVVLCTRRGLLGRTDDAAR